jgi:hypothetical protein
MITDLAVALFVAILVLGGLYVPRLGDALGRAVRGDGARAAPPAPEDPRSPPRPPTA